MEKVTVSKEVAEAIEDIREFYGNAEIIATIVHDRGNTAYGTKIPTLISYARHNGIETLMHALVNGYEVEKSPEEKLRNIFGEYLANYKATEDWERDNAYAEGVLFGVEETLDLLGITVEGINA